MIFLSDYDMLLTEQLVQGVDVWINTPRRPWEACGTSGMKVLVNGGINLSSWTAGGRKPMQPEVGWALGDGRTTATRRSGTLATPRRLFDLLEREVVAAVLPPRCRTASPAPGSPACAKAWRR